MTVHIIKVEVAPRRLFITSDDGATVMKDLSDFIAKGNLGADLDNLDFLRQVKIGQHGWSLEWPNGVEFDADSLWLNGRDYRLLRQKKFVGATSEA